MMYRFFRGLFVFLVLSLVAPFATVRGGVIDQVLVVIDGEPYTLSDFKTYAKRQMNRDFPAGDLNQLGKEDQEVVEQFITDKMLAAEVKQTGIKVGDDEVDNYINEVKEKNRIDEAQLKKALAAEGVAWEKYRASIRAEIEKSEIIDAQVRKRVNVTADDVQRYYNLNQKKYVSEQRVRLRHILLMVPEGADKAREKAVADKAAELRRRALAGEDFAQLAEAYSEGAGASEGGDIGWVTKGTLLKEIDQAAFGKLNVGEVSEPLRTSAGYHLIKLEAREGGKQLAFADVKDKVREEVLSKALDERFKKWLRGDLRRKHRVDVKLAGVVFRPEDTREGTMDALVASGRRTEESNWYDFLNPFKKTPTEDVDETGKPSPRAGQNVVSLLGTPLFRTESADDKDSVDEVLAPVENPKAPAEKPQESRGFWSRLNPLSK